MNKKLFPKKDNHNESILKYDIHHNENPYVKMNKTKKQTLKKGDKKK